MFEESTYEQSNMYYFFNTLIVFNLTLLSNLNQDFTNYCSINILFLILYWLSIFNGGLSRFYKLMP